jgi:hypothetical protein
MTAGPRRLHPAVPVAAAGALTWLLLAAPILPSARQLGERDTARLLYPVERTVASALRAGRLPFWDPRIECGSSILGQVTPAALHPFALLYLPLPFDLAFKLEHLLALLLGGIGAALFAAQLGASRWAALLAGIAFGGCGALVSSASGQLPYALGPAAAPLGVAGLLWFLRAPSAFRLLASAVALSLCVYGGDPQSFGIAVLVGLVLAALERPRAKRLASALAWAACALLLSAPAVLPAVPQLRRSVRREGISESDRRRFSAQPVRLLGLAVPLAFDATDPVPGKTGNPYSEFIARQPGEPFLSSICLGVPALLFAAAAARRRRALPLLAISLVLVLASTGPKGHVQPILEAVIPGWKLFRYTEKFLLHTSWLLAAAAAIGAEATLLGERRHARTLALVAAAVALVGFAALYLPLGPAGTILERASQTGYTHEASVAARFLDSLRSGVLQAAALSAVVAGVAFLRLGREASQVPLALAAAAAAASALIAPPLRTVSTSLYKGTSSTGRKLFELAGPSEGRWRVWNASQLLPALASPEVIAGLNPDEQRLIVWREGELPQLQALDGIEGAAGYFSALDSDYRDVLVKATIPALDILGIRFYIAEPGTPEFHHAKMKSPSGFGILQRPPTPRAFLVHRTRAARDSAEAIAALPSIRVFEEALVFSGAPILDGAGTKTAVPLRRPFPERIEASVEAPKQGLLVVAEHYDPGWRAQVDGRDVPVYATDVIVLGIPVPEGHHEVRLRYIPVGFIPGVFCAALTALVLGVLAIRHSPRPYSRIL